MNWIEHKYINLLSNRLRNFKRKNQNLYNFSCPICDDSQTNKLKARGYVYTVKGKTRYHCHNCGVSHTLGHFLKTIDISLFNEYKLESIKENTHTNNQLTTFVDKLKKPVFRTSGPLKGLKKISQLNPHDPCKLFIQQRKIPNLYHAILFKCPNFMHFTNELIPGKFSEDALKNDETRIVIPFFDTNKNVFAYQGRSLGKSDIKYITIVLDENVPKIYGLDTVKKDETVYITEGPFDSTQ